MSQHTPLTAERLDRKIKLVLDLHSTYEYSDRDPKSGGISEEEALKTIKLFIYQVTEEIIGQPDPTIYGGIINRGHNCTQAVAHAKNNQLAEQRKRRDELLNLQK